MDKTIKPQRKANLALILRMMLKYWYHGLAGLFMMMLYAIFSGISITLVIPLFDFVFKGRSVPILYPDWQSFLSASWSTITGYLEAHGGIFGIRGISGLKPLWHELQSVMEQTDPLALLYSICIFVFVVILLKNMFYYSNRMFFVVLRGRTIRDVRNYMFHRYLDQSMEFYNRHQVGDAIVRMVNDVDTVSNQFIYSIFNSIRDFSTIVVYMLIALTLNARLFLFSILVLPLFSLMMSFMGRKIKKYSRRIQSQLSTMFSAVEEVLNSMKVVKAFRREDTEIEAFGEINRRHLRLWQRSMAYSSLNVPISELNSTLTGVLVIVLGGSLILDPGSGFSLGNFTAFLFALFSMLHPLKTITQMYAEIKKAAVSLDRIALVLNQRSNIQDAPDAVSKTSIEDGIRLANVSFSYSAAREVLNGIDLEIPKGQKIAIVGSSGSGKTTLANLLNRMYDVTSGQIMIDGTDIRKIKLHDLRGLFGVVTQDSILFTKTVRENIAYGAPDGVSDEQIVSAAKIALAEEFILQLPGSYDQKLDTKGANLSGGQRQRLCIARAIVGNPPILIFDEATSALDTISERMVQQAIDAAMRNRTVILIAHRLSTVIACDRMVVLDQGRIVGSGTHDELLQTCAKYRELHDQKRIGE
jgi:subfamily B ATP-binding cassette protein MsbA